MKYVSVQPDNKRFHWEVEVYVNNFLSVGIKKEDIHVVWLYKEQISEELILLQRRLDVEFFCYKMEDVKGYLPALKPQGMKHHSKVLKGQKIFYHDSDIIFLKPVDFSNLCNCSWYVSDCRSYLNSSYIKSKGEELFVDMCYEIGINPRFVEHKDSQAGGAQWIMKSKNFDFWEKVEKDSITLYYLTKSHYSQLSLPYPIQSWTAEMWALLWNAWAYGEVTKIIPELNFIFSTNKYADIDKVSILHNSGVINNANNTIFCKSDYINKNPFDENFSTLNKDFAGYRYAEEIKKVAEKRKQI